MATPGGITKGLETISCVVDHVFTQNLGEKDPFVLLHTGRVQFLYPRHNSQRKRTLNCPDIKVGCCTMRPGR